MKKIILFDHNKATYEKLKNHFKKENKAAVIQPTGTGKSYVIAKLIDDNPSSTILVLSPSTHINDQIGKILGERSTLEFLTYQGLLVKDVEKTYDYIVLDEFHRCGAEKWGEVVDTLISNNLSAKLLGTSATPIRFLDGHRDMSDELFDGHVVENTTLVEAIMRGILPVPKYISSYYMIDEEIESMREKIRNSRNENKEKLYQELDDLKRHMEKSKGVPAILKKYIDPTEMNHKIIVFFSNREHMENMRPNVEKWVKEAFATQTVNVFEVYSGKSGNEKTIRAFETSKAAISLLFSIDMLNEGLHIGSSSVILMRPTKSPITYYQQIGRAMSSGMSSSPIIFDLVNNAKSIRAKHFSDDIDGFSMVNPGFEAKAKEIKDFYIIDESLDVFDELKNIEGRLLNDWDVLYDKYQSLYEDSGAYISAYVKGQTPSDLNEWATIQRKGFKNRTIAKDKAIKLIEADFVFDLSEALWTHNYNLLRDTLRSRDIMDIGFNFVYKGISLGKWINAQRSLYKKGLLLPERERALNKLGFVWEYRRTLWDDHFEELAAIVDEHGSYFDAVKNLDVQDPLYTWTVRVRQDYKAGKLDEEQIKALDNLGFSWDALMDKWLEKLDQYKRGDAKSLDGWCAFQRRLYRSGKLNPVRKKLLINAGFNFDKSSPSEDDLFEMCQEHFDKYGTFTLQDEAYKPIKHFLSSKKKSFRDGNMSDDELLKFRSIGFMADGDQYESRWYENYTLFKQYVKEYGLDTLKKRIVYKGFKLGEWAIRQRVINNRKKLPDWQKKLMEAEGFEF